MKSNNLVVSICLILLLTLELCLASASEWATHGRRRNERNPKNCTINSKRRPNSPVGPDGHHRRQSARPRIVNGRVTKPGEFPFVVRLVIHGKTVCTGTIIHESHVLTAAHCFEDPDSGDLAPPDLVQVVAGDVSIWDNKDGQVTYGAEEIFRHEQYERREKSTLNDIAIMRMNEDIEFTDGDRFGNGRVKKVALAHDPGHGELRSDYSNNTAVRNDAGAVALGWGYTNKDGDPSDRLMAFDTSLTDCKAAHVPPSPGYICSAMNPQSGICFGDSGGPLMAKSPWSGRIEQLGIVAFGTQGGCRPADIYYTKISHYYKWIKAKIASA